MTFIHDDPEFPALLNIVGSRRHLDIGLVEKDYWVTHTLWSLHEQGLEVWFKGGTSLSKGFGLIRRFSEDLDLKVAPGTSGLPFAQNWKSEGSKATRARREFFDAFVEQFRVSGAVVARDPDDADPSWRNVRLRVRYPRASEAVHAGWMRPFVLLEVGDARVTPYVNRDLSSFVHDELERTGHLDTYTDNRPRGVRCVHPLVTLIEKIDALSRRVPIESIAPAAFVRHFEDAARIVESESSLPPLDSFVDARALAADMLRNRQIRALPRSTDPALALLDGPRTDSVRSASDAISSMFWGPRISLDEACMLIREWIASRLE